MYDSDSLTALRQRVDLLEIVQSHLTLKRSGSTYKGLCPFHEEKSPSFLIKAGDSHYHCFGCGAHGDAIDFLMRFLGLGFAEAAEMLAQRYAIHLERRSPEERGGAKTSPKRRLKECLARAQHFFHFWLLFAQEGESARRYLTERSIDVAFVERFELGLAPERSGVLRRYLQEHGFTARELQEAGLLGEQGRDFFSKRILFPIRDALGHPIAFSGRKFQEETFGGKYINSPDTALFHKSSVLFGLFECRRQMAKARAAVVVEGQVDALRLIHAGFDRVCAPLGTAFGQGHARELHKLGVRSVCLAFDGDSAGEAAAVKAGHHCSRWALDVQVLQFERGQDPDALILQRGLGEFERLLTQASGFLEYLFARAGDWTDLAPGAKQVWIDSTAAEIQEWEHPVLVHESLRRLAHLAQIPEKALLQPRPLKTGARQSSVEGDSPTSKPLEPERILEGVFIGSLLQVAQQARWRPALLRASAQLRPEDLQLKAAGAIYRQLLKKGESQTLPTLSSLIHSTPDVETARLLHEIAERKWSSSRAPGQFQESLNAIVRRNWMTRREAIRLRIQSGTQSDEQAMALTRELAELIQNPPPIFEMGDPLS